MSREDQSPNPQAEALFRKGVALLKQRDLSKAVVALTHAVKAHRQYPEAYRALATALLASGEDERALKMLSLAARSYLQTGRRKDAAQFYLACRKQGRNIVNPFLAEGKRLMEQGAPDAAMKFFQLALKLAPENRETVLLLARCLKESDQCDGAIALLEQALDTAPDFAEAQALYQEMIGAPPDGEFTEDQEISLEEGIQELNAMAMVFEGDLPDHVGHIPEMADPEQAQPELDDTTLPQHEPDPDPELPDEFFDEESMETTMYHFTPIARENARDAEPPPQDDEFTLDEPTLGEPTLDISTEVEPDLTEYDYDPPPEKEVEKERREATRIPLIDYFVRLSRKEIHPVIDISRKGVGFKAQNHSFSPGEEFQFDLLVGKKVKIKKMTALVMHATRGAVGCRLERLTDKQVKALDDIVSSGEVKGDFDFNDTVNFNIDMW